MFGIGSQPMRRQAQAHQLHITRDRHPDIRRELAMKMKHRKVRHLAQGFYRQITFEVGVDVGEHSAEALGVGGVGRQVGHGWRLLEVRSA
ncbi:hypothetical protein D9M71_777370 [compost metagenome]